MHSTRGMGAPVRHARELRKLHNPGSLALASGKMQTASDCKGHDIEELEMAQILEDQHTTQRPRNLRQTWTGTCATQCNAVQRSATQCNAVQRSATQCNAVLHRDACALGAMARRV